MKSLKELLNTYEGKFNVAEESLGKPFVVSAVVRETGEIVCENKLLNGWMTPSKDRRGVGHVFFVDPSTGTQFIRWDAKDSLKNAIVNETTNVILLKVVKGTKKDRDGNDINYYRISEDVVTRESGASFLAN